MWFTDMMVWLGAYRIQIFIITGIGLWATIYILYFTRDIKRYRLARKPHRWEIDMENRTARREGKGKNKTH